VESQFSLEFAPGERGFLPPAGVPRATGKARPHLLALDIVLGPTLLAVMMYAMPTQACAVYGQ
jgi:hypothetical protein